MSFPIIRSHERIDFKRCPKKWYWKWRMGLVLKTVLFGALDLGTWVHGALSTWYCPGKPEKPIRRWGNLTDHFDTISFADIERARRRQAPNYTIEKAEELQALGREMVTAYGNHYGIDPDIEVIGAEIPLEFSFSDNSGKIVGIHRLKPDLIYRKRGTNKVWLMETKTATQVRTEHLVIDDQARPYPAMAERAMQNKGLLLPEDRFVGIMYNFLKKVLPDEREANAQGLRLNKNGSISKRQPQPQFIRKPFTLTTSAKRVTLTRLRSEVILITGLTEKLKKKEIDPFLIPKTPHSSCPKFCDYFTMCVAEEEGVDITEMRKSMFRRENPYEYPEDKEPTSFEFG